MTTALTKSFIEKAAAAESSLLPRLSANQKLTIETLENKKRGFQDDIYYLRSKVDSPFSRATLRNPESRTPK